MTDLYENIEQLCREKGITPGKMCSEVGISRGNLGDLKKERIKSLSAENLSKIAAYFDVSTDYLLGKTDTKKSAPVTDKDAELMAYLEELRTRPELKMLFSLTKDASKEDVEASVRIIEAFLNKENQNE